MAKTTFFDLNPQRGEVIDFDVEGMSFIVSDGEVRCGYGCDTYATYETPIPGQEFLRLTTNHGRMIRAVGDSMLGAGIEDDDLLSVDPTREPVDGDIVVMRLGDEVTVKYYYYDRRSKRRILVPANPEYAVRELTPDMQVTYIGVVTWAGKVPRCARPRDLVRLMNESTTNKRLQDLMDRTADAGYMDCCCDWTDQASSEFKAVWVDAVCHELGITDQWKWAEEKWDLKNLRKAHYNVMESSRFAKIEAEVKKIIDAE